MFQRKTNNAEQEKNRAQKILNSSAQIAVAIHGSQILSHPQTNESKENEPWVGYHSSIQELIANARAKKKPIIFTSVSGPFLKKEKTPDDWMKTPSVVGCTAQLNAFENALKENSLNAEVYGINKHTQQDQCSLLQEKGFCNIGLLDDSNNTLKEIFDLNEITVNDKKYNLRETIVIKPNNEVGFFKIPSPVTAEIAQQHIADIVNFITPQLTAECKP